MNIATIDRQYEETQMRSDAICKQEADDLQRYEEKALRDIEKNFSETVSDEMYQSLEYNGAAYLVMNYLSQQSARGDQAAKRITEILAGTIARGRIAEAERNGYLF